MVYARAYLKESFISSTPNGSVHYIALFPTNRFLSFVILGVGKPYALYQVLRCTNHYQLQNLEHFRKGVVR